MLKRRKSLTNVAAVLLLLLALFTSCSNETEVASDSIPAKVVTNKMKRIFLFFFALLSFGAIQAQTFRIGPTVVGDVDLTKDMKAQLGYALGAKGELMFSSTNKGWFADASVLFGNQRMKSKDYFFTVGNTTKYWKYSSYVLTVPINIGYKFNVANKLNIFVAGGPYVDFGLTGSSKVFTSNGSKVAEEKKISSNVYKDKLFNRVNFGVNAKVGFEVSNHCQISISYNRGMTNMLKKTNDVKMQNVQLGFAYMF